jgi:hypothetical protein
MNFIIEWLWERAAFVLAVLVLGGLILGWFLPVTQNAVFAFALGQIIMAVVVLIRESQRLTRDRTR